jgi:16S rRNA (cytosine967-C5)-methyltransferase
MRTDPRQKQPAADPRKGAVALLGAILGDGAMLNEVLASPPTAFAALDDSGRARAQRLATTVLRHLERADAVLKPHLRKAPPQYVLNVLRLAVVELCQENAAPHGVVNSAVGLVRADQRTQHMAGFANAVLRRVTELEPGTWEKLPPQRLPGWLRKPLVAQYGRPVMTAIEAAHMAGAPLDIRLKSQTPDWAEALEASVLPNGSLRRDGGRVTALHGYDTGDWWVQDAAAALPSQLLAPQKGERVLDLCAAPGGKTLQLAALGADVTALDISGTRMSRVHENLARCQLRAYSVVADALHWRPDAPFDAILLDAPCSATGTIRRHPDLPFVKDDDDLRALQELQAKLLDRVLDPRKGILKPGGRVVYCTCSLLAEEGEAQAIAALARHPNIRALPATIAGTDPAWQTPEGGMRTRPDYWAEHGGMDGFYMIALQHQITG